MCFTLFVLTPSGWLRRLSWKVRISRRRTKRGWLGTHCELRQSPCARPLAQITCLICVYLSCSVLPTNVTMAHLIEKKTPRWIIGSNSLNGRNNYDLWVIQGLCSSTAGDRTSGTATTWKIYHPWQTKRVRTRLDQNKWGKVSKNVTMRRVRLTTVAVEKQQLLHILIVCL